MGLYYLVLILPVAFGILYMAERISAVTEIEYHDSEIKIRKSHRIAFLGTSEIVIRKADIFEISKQMRGFRTYGIFYNLNEKKQHMFLDSFEINDIESEIQKMRINTLPNATVKNSRFWIK